MKRVPVFEVTDRAGGELRKLFESESHSKDNLVIYFQGFG